MDIWKEQLISHTELLDPNQPGGQVIDRGNHSPEREFQIQRLHDPAGTFSDDGMPHPVAKAQG